ncbi:glycosyltransferase family 2 protein [Marinobacter sp. C2H3]|uniref:glycosyltransferase family 2 protein n=1 Tax=Marinobacter sp. C2H3 TaxID=3119003 RepID=UPI00300EBC3D
MSPNVQVSVIIPVMNEAENIGDLMQEIHQALAEGPTYEIVVVDDGSSDGTLARAEETATTLGCRFQGIAHARNLGQSAAVKTGACHATGIWLVTLDGDGQNDPADIPALLERARGLAATDYVIAGYRRQRRDTRWKRFQSRLANRVRNALLHDGVPDSGCGLKLLPRRTFLALPWFDHAHRFVPALVRAIGGNVVVVDVNHRHRTRGVSKYSAWNRAWVGIVDLIGVWWLIHRLPSLGWPSPVEAERR